MHSLLIVEDDKNLAACISEYMAGYTCYTETTVKGGLRVARNRDIDLIVLDINLGSDNGLMLLKTLRSLQIETPVLILSSLDTTDNICVALKFGADGYLTKPFSMRELKARIDALLSRPPVTKAEILPIHDLVLDCNSYQVRRGRQVLNLRKKEFDILAYLVRNSDTVISRNQLISNIWDSYSEPYTSTVDVHVSNIRKQLQKTFGKDLIRTAHGLGYQVNSRKL